ncbi:MAG: hypothetical protein L6R38_001894 [Xanthoria sp. 2 TBL-2021]|nr:MAG: hypothetical protein L6R38_001894 [Xanthoria sp. 2 TBL-2021]
MYRLEKKQEKEAKKKAREAKREEKAAEAAQKLADNAARKPQDPKAKPRASKSNKSVGTKLRRKAALDSDGDRYMELSTEFVRLSDDEDSWEVSDPETSEDEGTVDESSDLYSHPKRKRISSTGLSFVSAPRSPDLADSEPFNLLSCNEPATEPVRKKKRRVASEVPERKQLPRASKDQSGYY